VDAVSTFEMFNRIAAENAAREAARRSPAAVARRAVYTLVSAMADLPPAEQLTIRRVLDDELAVLDRRDDGQLAPDLTGAGWRLLGCTHAVSCSSVEICTAGPA
jgi:hypothetical protein